LQQLLLLLLLLLLLDFGLLLKSLQLGTEHCNLLLPRLLRCRWSCTAHSRCGSCRRRA